MSWRQRHGCITTRAGDAYIDMLAIALKRLYPNAQIEAFNAGISGNTTVDR